MKRDIENPQKAFFKSKRLSNFIEVNQNDPSFSFYLKCLLDQNLKISYRIEGFKP
jgi:hypothetical protein